MADVTTVHPTHNADGKQTGSVLVKLVDNGDGTYSMATASAGSGTTSDEVQGNVASAATDEGKPVKTGGKYNLTPPTFTDGQRADMQQGSNGALRVALWPDSGATAVAVTTASTDGVSTGGQYIGVRAFSYHFNGTGLDRVTKATNTSRIVSAAADTNATSAKGSAGTLHTVTGYNAAAAVRYLKFYNKATAPVVGTDTPVLTIALKPTDAFDITFPFGRYFATGIAYAMTTGAADADTGALTAADVVGLNVNYS